MSDEVKLQTNEPHDGWLEDALNKLRAGFIVGGWAVGAAAGAVRWLSGESDAPLYECMLVSLGFVLLAGAVGGFAGSFARNALALLLKAKDTMDDRSADTVSGVALGSFCGAFLGLVAMLLIGAGGAADKGAAWGAGTGAFLGALPGQAPRVLLRMMAMDSRAKREERQQQREEKDR